MWHDLFRTLVMREIHVEALNTDKTEACERILRALPEWFGLEEPLIKYCKEVADLPVFVAKNARNEIVGLISLAHHNECTSEIHVVGVLPEYHRTGVGRALVDRVVNEARSRRSQLLSVKTLGPSHPNPGGYRATLQFYREMGFLPVEELQGVWDDIPCLLLVKVLNQLA